jgi:hypothetical protein
VQTVGETKEVTEKAYPVEPLREQWKRGDTRKKKEKWRKATPYGAREALLSRFKG